MTREKSCSAQAQAPMPGPHPLAAAVFAGLALLSGCRDGGAPTTTTLTQSPGLNAAPSLSTSGSLQLEQYDRAGRSGAVIARSTRHTLIPEGATP